MNHWVVTSAEVDPEEWNNFVLERGWFWHTTHWREYTRACTGAPELGFAVVSGPDLLAVAPGERAADSRGAVWAPVVRDDLDASVRARVLDLCLAELERDGPVRLQLSPLVPSFPAFAAEFLSGTIQRGYRDVSLTSSVVDVQREESELLADMRKGHRFDVRKNSHDVVASRFILLFHDLYRKAGGDRPLHLVEKWLDLGYAVVVAAWREGEPVSATLLLTFGDAAYPLAAAGTAGNAGHAVVWGAMRWLKSQGYRRYELGIQYRDPETSTEKERNISLFKRGFGGVEVPLIVREKP